MGEEVVVTPPFLIPEGGEELWEHFTDINGSISRIHDGVCKLIPPSEFQAWFNLRGLLVSPLEYVILQAMDRAYCEETTKELQSQRSKREEEMKRQVDEARSKKGARRR